MTRLFNDPKAFAREALAGLIAANPRYVQSVHGGVVRADASPDGQVALVVGGGSGHYPAFAGWVGQGMAHGAACGNIFASPSASQIYSVARASDNGGGVLFAFGNYAGDVLHFNQAAAQLRSDGTDVRIVTISDDIASNSPEQHADRRGIAGDLVVVKVTGAAAQAGLDLDQVETLAQRANTRTRTLGIAFAGCTLPGVDHAQFTVPEGQMAIGLGIHGEPGISTEPLGTANEVAELLVTKVLAESPDRGVEGHDARIAVVLNGLGATKYEELFVVFNEVTRLLAELNLTVVEPEVGEHVTSLDMSGLSLTITFLDPELEELWTAAVDAPALRKGGFTGTRTPRTVDRERTDQGHGNSTPESRRVAEGIHTGLRLMALTAAENEAVFAELDSVAGDGDHGQGMTLGTAAAAAAAKTAVATGSGASTTLIQAGEAWSEGAGGTSGALWGAALAAAGRALTDSDGATPAQIIEAVQLGGAAISEIGGAQVGDKTMVDAVVPFIEAFTDCASENLATTWRAAAEAATSAAAATADMTARLGRARTHGDNSLGHPDPGATSFALLMRTIVEPYESRQPTEGATS